MVYRLTCALVAAAVLATTGVRASAADAAHGKQLFSQKCAVCHTIDSGGTNGVGPNLFGVVGTRSGAVPGFNFSAAMKNAAITWTPEELVTYLQNPAKRVPGTYMSFQGFSNAADAADVVEFLKTAK